jgi:hypothetical protein
MFAPGLRDMPDAHHTKRAFVRPPTASGWRVKVECPFKLHRPLFFDTRNFKSSTFDKRNFSKGDVLASL